MDAPLVIFHAGCRDGWCAAWVLRGEHKDAEFFPGYYGQGPPAVTGRDVILADFSYPRDVMEKIAEDAASVLVLDHHRTAQTALDGFGRDRGNVEVVFDMERSGAGLAWDYYNGTARPWLVDYVEDRDLWRHKLPHSEEINAYISVLPFDFATWDSADHKTEATDFLLQGQVVLAKTRQYVAEVQKNARRIQFEGHDVPIVNAPQVDISELLSSLCNGEKFAMGWWQRSDGVFQYSLRSRGGFDVSELAKRYEGGGHAAAAGFQSTFLLGST